MAKKEKKKGSADIRIGEPIKKTVRVKINVIECAKKEAEVVKKEILVKKIQIKMSPLKQEITKLNKEIDKLCADVESSTEERTVLVREEFHYKTSVVRVVEDKGGELVEERTMTREERQFDLTQKPGGVIGGKAGKALRLANPVLTPGEAMAAARKTRSPRTAADPRFQAALEASDAQDGPEAEA